MKLPVLNQPRVYLVMQPGRGLPRQQMLATAAGLRDWLTSCQMLASQPLFSSGLRSAFQGAWAYVLTHNIVRRLHANLHGQVAD